MGVFLDEPKYKVEDRDPGFWKIVGNFNVSDAAAIVGITGASMPLGYLAGRSAGVPRQSMIAMTGIGLMGSFMYAQQMSAGRLMGLFDNGKPL